MEDDPDEAALVRALVSYVRINPLACDTADGICRWWLPPPRVSQAKLLEALNWMKRHGLMEELIAADGRLRYRRSATDEQLQAAVTASRQFHRRDIDGGQRKGC